MKGKGPPAPPSKSFKLGGGVLPSPPAPVALANMASSEGGKGVSVLANPSDGCGGRGDGAPSASLGSAEGSTDRDDAGIRWRNVSEEVLGPINGEGDRDLRCGVSERANDEVDVDGDGVGDGRLAIAPILISKKADPLLLVIMGSFFSTYEKQCR